MTVVTTALAAILVATAACSTSIAADGATWDSPLAKLHPDSPSVGSPTDGLNVLIADRGNNRLLIVGPDQRTIWEYDFPHLPRNAGAYDAFFADGGKSIIVNLEHWQIVELIDVATKAVTWTYGVGGQRGAAPGLLDYPDDAYQLPDGNVVVADIRNCRVLEIGPDKRIMRQYGKTGQCWGPGSLAGKGFAVVAIEVRRLAQSAAGASKDIKTLIDQSAAEVATGSGLVRQAVEQLSAVLDGARQSALLVSDIAAASKTQATTIAEISVAVRDMDEMTQHNAALVEETNAALEKTDEQAAALDQTVDVFRIDGDARSQETSSRVVHLSREKSNRAA